jgi:hypothetical protein
MVNPITAAPLRDRKPESVCIDVIGREQRFLKIGAGSERLFMVSQNGSNLRGRPARNTPQSPPAEFAS